MIKSLFFRLDKLRQVKKILLKPGFILSGNQNIWHTKIERKGLFYQKINLILKIHFIIAYF